MSREHLLGLLVVAACGSHRAPAAPPAPPANEARVTPPADATVAPRRWRVFDGELAILDVSDQPGPILSTAPLPPGGEPAMHPFLSATALDAGHEDRLRQLLVGAHDVDGFLRALADAGFRVEPQ